MKFGEWCDLQVSATWDNRVLGPEENEFLNDIKPYLFNNVAVGNIGCKFISALLEYSDSDYTEEILRQDSVVYATLLNRECGSSMVSSQDIRNCTRMGASLMDIKDALKYVAHECYDKINSHKDSSGKYIQLWCECVNYAACYVFSAAINMEKLNNITFNTATCNSRKDTLHLFIGKVLEIVSNGVIDSYTLSEKKRDTYLRSVGSAFCTNKNVSLEESTKATGFTPYMMNPPVDNGEEVAQSDEEDLTLNVEYL